MKFKKNIAVSENGFVFDPTTGESFTVNPIGSEIIHLFQKEKSLEEILELLHTKYEIERASLERYLYDFQSMLHQYNLLENQSQNL